MLTAVLASIPSPSSGEIKLGPLQLRAYGLMIALGVLAAVWLAGRRLEARGAGTREDISYVALWAVPAGVIGSRLYHVATDWRRYQGHWLNAFKIWEGGLGIWGGIGLGVAVGIWAAMRRGIPLQGGLSAITPALPLAQAIGRWGNWWNQELFGRPTNLPWALEVSPGKAIAAGYPAGTTFHPTFLYESLWCLLLCGALIWIDKRFRPWGTELFAMYVAGYTFVRFWIERIRVDPATIVWGWRINEVVSLVVCGLAILYLIVSMTRRPRPALVAAGGVGAVEADDDHAGEVADGSDEAEDEPSDLDESDVGEHDAGDTELDDAEVAEEAGADVVDEPDVEGVDVEELDAEGQESDVVEPGVVEPATSDRADEPEHREDRSEPDREASGVADDGAEASLDPSLESDAGRPSDDEGAELVADPVPVDADPSPERDRPR